MTIDEQIKVLQAYKDGKKIEWKCKFYKDKWCLVERIEYHFNFPKFYYRIAPEPELIPWTAEDVPMPICWVNEKEGNCKILPSLVVDIQKSGVIICVSRDGEFVDYDKLFRNYEHSVNGKTWKPCGKEA